jgi:hypothetical protein
MASGPFNPRSILLGCVALVGLLAVLGTGTVAGLFFMVKSSVEGMTEEAPRPMPPVTMDAPALDALKAHFDAFLAADGPATLELDAEAINGLMLLAGDRGPVDWLRVELEGDQLFGQISLPLHRLGAEAFGLGNRYLNARVALDARFEDGRLNVFIRDIQLGDTPIPEDILAAISQQNISGQFTTANQERDAILSRIGRIEVRDSRVVLTRKES